MRTAGAGGDDDQSQGLPLTPVLASVLSPPCTYESDRLAG
jgi:hypothetical protein